jgi:uncharacterized membrane protein YsdA (DUF1294 family)
MRKTILNTGFFKSSMALYLKINAFNIFSSYDLLYLKLYSSIDNQKICHLLSIFVWDIDKISAENACWRIWEWRN